MYASLLLVALAAPVSAPPAAAPTDPITEGPAATYTRARADADLDTLLVARGREYLDARARLEDNAALVAPLVAGRLAATTPALGPAERQRLLALLGAFGRPEDLRVFAEQLRREAIAAGPGGDLSATEPWRLLLREQGSAAADLLGGLIADRALDEGLRALLLGDLIAILPTERLPEFVALVGAGEATLRQALRQALARRARKQPAERAGLVAAVDQAITGAPPSQQAALLGLRAAMSPSGEADPAAADDGFIARLLALAEGEATAFVVRVAAIRILAARADVAPARAALLRIAAAHLAPAARQRQVSEILGWLALQGLPPAEVTALVGRLDLVRAESPRIAAAAYGSATLDADGAWLSAGLEHPWPEVQAAALARVAPPCPRDVVRQLAATAAPPERRGTDDLLVAREAIRALGRCGEGEAETALLRLLGNNRVESQRRGEAARQLLVGGRPPGIAAVTKALETAGDPEVVRRLVEAVRAAGSAPEPVVGGLCQVALDLPALRSAVADTLRQVAPGSACAVERGE